VTVNSCTSALFLSLITAGVGAGDEVICPSFTWCSTANAALYAGARPVFCDIDAATLSATVESIAACVTPRTRAVVVVHFGGLAMDVAALRDALPDRVVIIEDAAHAFGGAYPDGRQVGSSGNPTCFSFYANKNLSTAEGGAVALADGGIADRLRSLRQHALPLDAWKRFTHATSLLLSNKLTELGYKMNYIDLQAAIGRVQLTRQAAFAQTRLNIAKHYVATLAELRPALALQAECLAARHARHLFTVRLPAAPSLPSRDEVIVALRARNIGASIHYAPLHTMPLYNGDRPPPDLPVTTAVAQQTLTLPISASMTMADAMDVTDAVKEAMLAGVA
jgi:dTDP-4-amino-4,6-dideoxygalactose transaminase